MHHKSQELTSVEGNWSDKLAEIGKSSWAKFIKEAKNNIPFE